MMTLQEAVSRVESLEEALSALSHAMGVLSVDGETVAPKRSVTGRARTMGYLSGLYYEQVAAPDLKEALQTILNAAAADPVSRRKAEVLWDDLEDTLILPKDEYVAFQTLLSEAGDAWHDAKEKSDYPLFAPYLEKLLAFQRHYAALKDSTRSAYDVLLDGYEKGMCMDTLDPFFALLQEKLTPVIQAVAEHPLPEPAFLRAIYPIERQRVFSDRVMELMGIDRACCAIGETEHPFTDGNNKWDVRITTHYFEDNAFDSLYSVVHEGGHAIYEMGVDDAYQFTTLAGGSCMSIHESQSRFYENLIGRSLPFCRALLPVMRDVFPEQLRGVTPEALYEAVNLSKPSLIRTMADELTYPMHIMIRYELEKRMLSGEVKVAELPALWNEYYRRYLGVTPACDREGVLQDSHWSGGAFGYFPSYALGSAYGVQMLENMERDVDVWGHVEKGDLSPVTQWLRERIHRHGQMLKPRELLQNALCGPFDPQKYVDYLTRKFTALYRL